MQKGKENIVTKIENKVRNVLADSGVNSVIVGISGGADSVALLRVLSNIGVSLRAIHCNFHLRGEESDRDCRFVETLCREKKIELDIVDFDVDKYRREHGGSVEMACRELRYPYFEKKRAEYGADRIAVAHNSDDNAETLLLNLFRGAGISGLRAMKSDTGTIIRPLLSVSRKEIEEYLAELNQPFIIDSTNLSSDYRRNFLRNEVLPLIEREWPEVKCSINRTARIMGEEERGMEAIFEETVKSNFLPYNIFKNKESGRLYLRRFVVSKGGSDKIVLEMWESIKKEKIRKGARWKTPKGEFIFSRDGMEWIEGFPLPEGSDLSEMFEWECVNNSPELMRKIREDRSNNSLWVAIDPSEIIIRTRISGDRIKPLGMKGSRAVSDIISESSIPARKKRDLAVVEDQTTGEILWVESLKRSRNALISENDKKIWSIKRKDKDKR